MNWLTPRPFPAFRSSCSLLDVPCHVGTFLAPFWFWIQVGLWVAGAIVVLIVLGYVNRAFGWRGVATAVAGLAGFGVYVLGYMQGRRSVKVATISGVRTLTKEQEIALQKALAARHLYPGPIDGNFGVQSVNGLKAFQRQRGEKVTGKPTYEQLRDLGIDIPRQ